MRHLRVRIFSLGGIVLVAVLIFFLMRFENVEAAWSYRNNEAIDATFACQDGIYIGVGHDGSLPGQDIIVTAYLQPDDDVVAEEIYVPPEDPDPDTPPYADYYFLAWDEAYQPLPVGSEIYINPFFLTVADCQIDPEDTATGTGFTYQGRLDDGGSPVNGMYDLRFRLYNSSSGGSQVGGTVWKHDLQVNDGLFTVELDFGATALDSNARWLQIGVRPGNSNGGVTVLNPRQPLTAVPYAHSLRAGAVVSGTVPERAILNLRNNIGDGLHVDWAATGIHVASAAEDGILLENAGANGVSISDPSGAGIMVSGSGGSGINVYSPDGTGVYVSNATGTGFFASGPDSTGFYASDPGGTGFYTWSPDDDGFAVSSAGDDGLYVGSAADDGVEVWSASNDGIYIRDADDDGIQIGSPGDDGIWIGLPADDGIDVDGSNYAGFFWEDIYVLGSCTGCTIAMFAQNSGELSLQPGDIVSIQGMASNEVDNDRLPVLPEVTLAQNNNPVIGVVQGWAELIREEDVRPGHSPLKLVPREGAAAPGDYVTIVTHGPMQVRADALDQTITAGDRLAVSDGGQARALQTVTVDGVQLAESAPTIGIALEDLATSEADGLIWVLVNPN